MIKLENILLLLFVTMMSCDSEFKEINTNPNASTTVDSSSLFTHAQRVTFNDGSFYNEALLQTYTWTQQFSNKYLNDNIFQRNQFARNVNNSYWNQFYVVKMPNITDLKRKLESESDDLKAIHTNQRAMVNIIQVLNAHFVVDTFGGIPYSEAFNAFNFNSQNFLPKYDTQKEVYTAMLEQLKSATTNLTTDSKQENFSSDLWYGGDVDKWKRLANSLRLRLAVRISDVEETLAKSVITDLLKTPSNLISSNDDNLVFKYAGSTFNNPLYDQSSQFLHETAGSKKLINFLESTGDPRLRIFFNKATKATSPNTYVGVPVSPDERDATSLFAAGSTKEYNSKYSRGHAQAWFNKKFPECIINYAEVLLLRAEIAQKGWSSEDAKQLYNKGIKASIEFYSAMYKEGMPLGENKNPSSTTDKAETLDLSILDVTEAEITALIAAPGVLYNSADAANQIGIQQWINHHRNPRELLSNFRRTDIPNATSTPSWETITAGKTVIPRSDIPKRFIYPATEYALNKSNLESFIQKQGLDLETTRLWWDKK